MRTPSTRAWTVAIAVLAVATALVLGGCGLGDGPEKVGGGATLRITNDFGQKVVSKRSQPKVRAGQTVMRLLRAQNDVKTRYGGGFVQSIDGVSGGGSGGGRDWFYWVNGLLGEKGANQYDLSPGDVVQWDYRDWRAAMDVRAIVGAFPEPFVHGRDGRRFPTRVECEDAAADACDRVKSLLDAQGVVATGSSLGASGTQKVIRVVVSKWSRARQLPTARLVEQGPKRSGVFARFANGGSRLQLLGPDGSVARQAPPGTGLIAATEPSENEFLWLVTGVDEAGVMNAAKHLRASVLRDAFAVAIAPDGAVQKLPVGAGSK